MEVFFCEREIDLTNCKIGELYNVKKISEKSKQIKKRLLDLGFVKGQEVLVIQKSMLNNTLLVQVQGYVLSMRKNVAEMVKLR